MIKKFYILLAILVLLIQFIRPNRNEGKVYTSSDITYAVEVPDDVKIILDKACNDCHSNFTNYDGLWYLNIQPIGWWINHHIEEGKQHLNFSDFNTYSIKKKAHKMEEIAEQVQEGEMPMESYTWMHSESKLTEEEKNILINWANKSYRQLKSSNESNQKK